MSDIKFFAAMLCAKISSALLKLKGTGGTSAPGKFALSICRNFISEAIKNNKEKIFTVTGTNGKTTTAGVLAHIAEFAGKKTVHNTKGANMLSGIASAIAEKYPKKTDFAIFESDEAYLPKLYENINADYLIVTNLFRDQLDRYGELDTTYAKIAEAVKNSPTTTVVLNADDPTLEGISGNNPKITFGFNEIQYEDEIKNSKSPAENTICPKCGKNLEYDEIYYAHLGKYRCECGYARPVPDYAANVKIGKTSSVITLNGVDYHSPLPGLYNAYNILAAISQALEAGINTDCIQSSVKTYSAVFGRSEKRTLFGKNALIWLIKNPVGASEVLRLLENFQKSNLLFVLNDNYADGRDVSWIWDADFELLKNHTGKIFISGTRAFDAALRLKYAGVDTKLFTVDKNIKQSVKNIAELTSVDDTFLVLPTYTALLKISKLPS